MLSVIDLNQRILKEDYNVEIKELQNRLSSLSMQIRYFQIPVIIVLEGWSASGKGTMISKILYPLDPRTFSVYTMGKVNEDIVMRPYLWSYWTKTPVKGRLIIYDKSWHRLQFDNKMTLTEADQRGFYEDINAFERQLHDDGAVIIKLFMHISKSEQKKRLEKLLKNPSTSWRINESDINQNKNYHNSLNTFEDVLQNTNTSIAPWSIIEANDKKFATIKTYKSIIAAIENEINIRGAFEGFDGKNLNIFNKNSVKILSSVNMDKDLENYEYKNKLRFYQNKLANLAFQLYIKRRSVVIVYEGWDAAGKGGNIKRLTEQLDPRAYEVIPIAAPTPEEKSRHYLWRFWNKIPKDGHLAIFDRSWYGRVMVERIEGLCTIDEYQRAYSEINEMERHISNHGTVIIKFWLNIDKDEQLKRFKDRIEDPLKSYKITDEDWRNREKWDQYEEAVDEMLFKTSTSYAPWVIIESNSKKYARIKTLKHVTDVIEKALNE